MQENLPEIRCTKKETEELQQIACSRTAVVWRIKRAKIILGALAGRTVDQQVRDVRVPPQSIIKCRKKFVEQGLKYFNQPDRKPTNREAAVEKMLAFLECSPSTENRLWNKLTVRYIGLDFTAAEIRKIRTIIETNPQYNRKEITREVCRIFGIYQTDGRLKTTAVGGILRRMDMDNIITLPFTPFVSYNKHSRACNFEVPETQIIFKPEELKQLQFIPVATKRDSDLWNELVMRFHYIKGSKLFGRQMRYLVYGGEPRPSEKNPKGREEKKSAAATPSKYSMGSWKPKHPNPTRGKHLLAVLGFGASSWRLSSRDDFIGWTEKERIANLNLVVGNVRFLILPWVRSHCLASRILGGIAKKLPLDWEDRYHFKPILLETFVQLDRFTGTCYRAANWQQVGTTKGYSLRGHKACKSVPEKAIFLYPLRKDFRRILCTLPK